MDAIGLRDRLVEMAERIASQGYYVLVPNVFYRSGRAPLVEELADLLKPENRPKMMETLGPFTKRLPPVAAVRDAGSYLEFLTGEQLVRPGPVGVTGYCMGGALALRTAAAFPERVASVASFHGGNLATEASDSPHLGLGQVRAEVYVGHADNDGSMPPEQMQRLSTTAARSRST